MCRCQLLVRDAQLCRRLGTLQAASGCGVWGLPLLHSFSIFKIILRFLLESMAISLSRWRTEGEWALQDLCGGVFLRHLLPKAVRRSVSPCCEPAGWRVAHPPRTCWGAAPGGTKGSAAVWGALVRGSVFQGEGPPQAWSSAGARVPAGRC